MVSGGRVVIGPVLRARVDVDGRVIEPRNAVNQLVVSLVGDGVGVDDAEGVVDGQLDLGTHTVPVPAQLNTVDAAASGHIPQGGLSSIDQIGVDRVHETCVHRRTLEA